MEEALNENLTVSLFLAGVADPLLVCRPAAFLLLEVLNSTLTSLQPPDRSDQVQLVGAVSSALPSEA